MDSRVDKYYSNDSSDAEVISSSTRSGRNAKLYKQVYGKYGDLDNLPIEDNTDEIDMERLRELIEKSTKKKEEPERKINLNILEQKKRRIDEQRIYDINKILEKAKYENNKLKDTSTNIQKINRDILSTLQSSELSLEEIKRASEQYKKQQEYKQKKEINENITEEKLSMTRELKYQNLLQTEEDKEEVSSMEKENFFSSNDLSLDLFEDLKPTGNTIITKPIRDEDEVKVMPLNEDIRSGDTRDIDIIKTPKTDLEKNDFFTSSYEFSKKDFAVDEDFEDLKSKGGILKIILLILAIIVFVGVIVYFVGTYGLGL